MSRIRDAVVAVALLALALAACASAPAAERPKPRRDCVTTREINVMSPLDDRHVYVRAGANRNYLFTMDGQCQGLHLARRLTVFDAATRVCEGGDSLLAFEHVTVGSMRCRIARIDSVADKDDAVERARAEVPPK